MNEEKIVAELCKRIKNLRWARWFVVLFGIFILGCSVVVYQQGKRANEIAGGSEYGSMFWRGIDINEEYLGMIVFAENRYSTAALYVGASVFMFVTAFCFFLTYRREMEILNVLERLKGEQDAGGNGE